MDLGTFPNKSIRIPSLGTVEVTYISLGRAIYFGELLEIAISDKDFVIKVLHRQIVEPQLSIEDIQVLSDEELETLARFLIQIEPSTFQYFKNTGDIYQDFKQAFLKYQNVQAEEMKTMISNAIRPALENVANIIQANSLFLNKLGLISESIIAPSQIVYDALNTYNDNIRTLGEQVLLTTGPIIEAATASITIWQSWVDANDYIFNRISDYWDSFHKQYEITEKEAVQILKRYKWFISPSFPLHFVYQVVELGRREGNQYKAINDLFVDYFQKDNWTNLEEMIHSWKDNPVFKGRYKIILDCLKTVQTMENNNVNVANVILPTLIVLIDGVTSKYLEQKGLSWKNDFTEDVVDKAGVVKEKGRITQYKNIRTAVLSSSLDEQINHVFLEILFRSSRQVGIEQLYDFNRHKVLHGKTVRYGKKVHMIRAFMTLDFLAHLAEA